MRRRRTEREWLYQTRYYRDLAARLASNVKRLRVARGWTQEQAAQLCAIAPRMFQAIEAADANVTLATLARLTSCFEVEPQQLFRRQLDPGELANSWPTAR